MNRLMVDIDFAHADLVATLTAKEDLDRWIEYRVKPDDDAVRYLNSLGRYLRSAADIAMEAAAAGTELPHHWRGHPVDGLLAEVQEMYRAFRGQRTLIHDDITDSIEQWAGLGAVDQSARAIDESDVSYQLPACEALPRSTGLRSSVTRMPAASR